jgi:hypothetical protein
MIDTLAGIISLLTLFEAPWIMASGTFVLNTAKEAGMSQI